MHSRGQVLTAYVLAWRAGRGSGDMAKRAFAEVCAISDVFNAEARTAGRPPISQFVEASLYQGQHMDRRRPNAGKPKDPGAT